MMILLAFILRMWPILLLMLIGVFFYALWMLFHMDPAPQQPVQAPLLALPPPASEESVLNTAFSVLQRRITEQVLLRYPNARWVWGVADARERFVHGGELSILLNRAGGYRRAVVQVNNLQFCGLQYPTAEQPQQPASEPETEPSEEPEQEPETVDYGLLGLSGWRQISRRSTPSAMRWIGSGKDSFRIPASQLPHGDSWPPICKELLRNGFFAAEPLADGIQVQIKVK